jgi:CDP-diacylglycerol--glycerol-3-phosphate 3-phosphatidyltransferase
MSIAPYDGVRVWKALPNAISLGRLLVSPVLFALILMGRETPFKWLLAAAMLSDVVDGYLARHFGLQSTRGAFLDSVADILVTVTAALGVIWFRPEFVSAHSKPLLFVVVLYLGEVLGALWRYGRVSSFHTYLARAAGQAQGAFVLCLLFIGYFAWLFYATIAISVIAYAEEVLLLWLLPGWKSDVRGLYWVLSSERWKRGV